MPTPRSISILMPVKNAEPWLDECLQSILVQDHSSWECIVVDDHSSDLSVSIARSFEARDPRFSSLKSEGVGIIHALRTALKRARYPWISRMDADDIMPPHKLSELDQTLNGDRHAVATGKVRYFGDVPITQGYLDYQRWLNDRIDLKDHWSWIYRECVIASANWLTHRDHVHFDSDRYPEDYDLVFDWYEKDLSVKVSGEITHHWREHARRTSRLSKDYGQKSFFDLKTRRFLKHDKLEDRPLVVFGTNRKTKWVQRVFASEGIDALFLDEVSAIRVESLTYPQVLVGVFPELDQRIKIADWLNGLGLRMGRDWWWI